LPYPMKNKRPKNRDDVSAKSRFVKKQKEGNKKSAKPNPEPYKNIPVDSFAERYTLMWLFELEKFGFIRNIRRADSFMLFETVTRNWVRRLKTKSVPEVETLLSSHLYTPDFTFEVTDKGLELSLFTGIKSTEKLRQRNRFNLICNEPQDRKYTCLIETKGTGFRLRSNTTEKFHVDQKWLWSRYGLYVNLFIPEKVFALTFTPTEYRFTEKLKKPRKIDWEIRTIQEYIQTL
jgi:hypothetical protein